MDTLPGNAQTQAAVIQIREATSAINAHENLFAASTRQLPGVHAHDDHQRRGDTPNSAAALRRWQYIVAAPKEIRLLRADKTSFSFHACLGAEHIFFGFTNDQIDYKKANGAR